MINTMHHYPEYAFLNEWVDCKGIHPKLPLDTMVIVRYSGGFVSEIPYPASRIKWNDTRAQYKVESYRIIKV